MFETGEPETGPELAAALQRLTQEGARTLGTLPVAVFFGPQRDKWSPAEHVRHLRKSSAPLVVALKLPTWLLRLRFGHPKRASRTFLRLRDDYRQTLATGGQAGRFAPRREAAPHDPDVRRAEIMTDWSLTNSRLVQALGSWNEQRLDTVQLPHPLLGMLTLREMMAFTVYHTSHHLTLVMQRVDESA